MLAPVFSKARRHQMNCALRAPFLKKFWRDALCAAAVVGRKMERRVYVCISTLRSHIEAMGGELEVIAKFPDGVVKINNLAELA